MLPIRGEEAPMLCVCKEEDYYQVGKGDERMESTTFHRWRLGDMYPCVTPPLRSFLPPFLVFHTSICVLVESYKELYGYFFQLFHQNKMYQWCLNKNKAEVIVVTFDCLSLWLFSPSSWRSCLCIFITVVSGVEELALCHLQPLVLQSMPAFFTFHRFDSAVCALIANRLFLTGYFLFYSSVVVFFI